MSSTHSTSQGILNVERRLDTFVISFGYCLTHFYLGHIIRRLLIESYELSASELFTVKRNALLGDKHKNSFEKIGC